MFAWMLAVQRINAHSHTASYCLFLTCIERIQLLQKHINSCKGCGVVMLKENGHLCPRDRHKHLLWSHVAAKLSHARGIWDLSGTHGARACPNVLTPLCSGHWTHPLILTHILLGTWGRRHCSRHISVRGCDRYFLRGSFIQVPEEWEFHVRG